MNLRKEINDIRTLEHKCMLNAAAVLGTGWVSYATNMPTGVYVSGCLSLGLCAYGLYNSNKRNKLIGQLEVKERFGDRR